MFLTIEFLGITADVSKLYSHNHVTKKALFLVLNKEEMIHKSPNAKSFMQISTANDIVHYLTNDGMKDELFKPSLFRKNYKIIGSVRIKVKYFKSRKCPGYYKGTQLRDCYYNILNDTTENTTM